MEAVLVFVLWKAAVCARVSAPIAVHARNQMGKHINVGNFFSAKLIKLSWKLQKKISLFAIILTCDFLSLSIQN